MSKIRMITLERLLEMIVNNEKFTLVDVLSAQLYKEGHLPGAVSLPMAFLASHAGEKLKKSDLIVAYCAGYFCHASTKACEQLMGMGYKNVLDFKGGKKLWTMMGLELEK